MNQQTLLLMLGGLALLGVVSAVVSGRRATKRAARGVREVTRMTGNAVRTLVTAAVVTVVQWLIVTHTSDTTTVLVTLAFPALFAGLSVARLFAVTQVIYSTKGGRR
ncbi:hypothetical protein GCM10029964_115810 [Kibdelosporangium lantanae]